VRRNLRLALVVLGVGAAFLTFGVVGALAGFPHFKSVTTSISTSSTGTSATTTATTSSADLTQAFLEVSFKEVGLGSNEGTDVLVTADASAAYACINKGGRNPKAANKMTVSAAVNAEATFTSDKNGSISGTLTTDPAPGPGDFTCSSGQTLVLASVTFSNIVLTDVTNGISTTADDITAVFFQV
jgi:hypothetical protein